MTRRTLDIDEELMRRMLGTGGSLLDAPDAVPARDPSTQVQASAVPVQAATSSAEEEPSERRRRITIPDFEQTFLVPQDIRNRAYLYVSGATKQKILEVIRKLGNDRMSVTSYVENILHHHLELYKDEINRLYRQRNTDTLL